MESLAPHTWCQARATLRSYYMFTTHTSAILPSLGSIYAQMVVIVKGCPRLVWPSLLIHVAPEFINIAASPIILHDLSYASFSANSLSTIFQLVSFPSLRELVCSQTEAHPFTEPISFRSLLSLLARSARTLDKLQIAEMHSLPGDLVTPNPHVLQFSRFAGRLPLRVTQRRAG